MYFRYVALAFMNINCTVQGTSSLDFSQYFLELLSNTISCTSTGLYVIIILPNFRLYCNHIGKDVQFTWISKFLDWCILLHLMSLIILVVITLKYACTFTKIWFLYHPAHLLDPARFKFIQKNAGLHFYCILHIWMLFKKV